MNTNATSANILKPALFLILGLMMIGAAWWLTAVDKEKKEQEIQGQRQEFFATQGVELINREENRNREAIDRAQQQLAEHFSRYRSGVPHFAEELTTWGTRYEITKAVLKDWWSNSNTARTVTADLFAKCVVSDQQLQANVTAVIAQFSSDLEANRNIMLSELQDKVSIAKVPCAATNLDSTKLTETFMVEVRDLLKQRAVQSPAIGLLATGGGFIAGEAATQLLRNIITKILNSMTVRVVTGAAARGSAVAIGALEGGAGGTAIAPGIGTAIGIVGGIAVGWAVEWWMDSKFKEKVTTECNQILKDMEESLWKDSKHPDQGLASHFDLAVKTTRECHETALRKIIVGDNK